MFNFIDAGLNYLVKYVDYSMLDNKFQIKVLFYYSFTSFFSLALR